MTASKMSVEVTKRAARDLVPSLMNEMEDNASRKVLCGKNDCRKFTNSFYQKVTITTKI